MDAPEDPVTPCGRFHANAEPIGLSQYSGNHDATGLLAKRHAAIVVVAALVTGAPTIRGGFVGADDQRLVLNHVLVSQPSIAHTVELFTIPHRDLYQPLPLASFALEFAVARFAGLDARGADGVAWLCHLDNVLLHAANALLVWLVILRWHALLSGRSAGDRDERALTLTGSGDEAASRLVATCAALLFAVHPVQAEVVGWVNGRMMLMSTLFALLTVLSFLSLAGSVPTDGRTTKRSLLRGTSAVVFGTLCGLSKIRVGLPILALLPLLVGRRWRDRRAVLIWIGLVLVTGTLAAVNIRTTASANMFAGGEAVLKGPSLVRVVLALASYVQHIFWPIGLASYYPAPPIVGWRDSGTLRAMAMVVPVAALWIWRMTRSRPARLGFVWFAGTLASTLPFIPARNLLSADRYLYLPLVGLFWALSFELIQILRRFERPVIAARVIGVVYAGIVVIGVPWSWHVGSFYATAVANTRRVAVVSPNVPRLWTHAAWAQFERGDYRRARKYAERDLAFEGDAVAQSGALELIGACELKLGDRTAGYATLGRAVEMDPNNAKAMYRLGVALAEAGDIGSAVEALEAAVEAAPRYNPPLVRLAELYVESGRRDEARTLYGRAVEINAYDVGALSGLLSLDIRETLVGSDALVDRGITAEASDLWRNLQRQWPHSAEVRVWATWTGVLAERAAEIPPGQVPSGLIPIDQSARALLALQRQQYQTATAQVQHLVHGGEGSRYAQRRLLRALQQHDQRHPGDAWTMCLAARLLIADGQWDAGRAFTGVCASQCKVGACAEWIQTLEGALGAE